MKGGRGRSILGVLATLVVLLVVFVALVVGTRSVKGLGYEPAAVAATTGPSISLSAMPDSFACHGSNGGPGGGPHPEWVTYCPSTSIKVPAYSTITVTIRQYDTGGLVHNPFFSHVKGTVGRHHAAQRQAGPEREPGRNRPHVHAPDSARTRMRPSCS